jgi:hypothetical protein
MKNWLKARWEERTTLDGLVLIAICLSVIVLGSVAKILAYLGLIYGVYTTVVRG